MATSYIILSNSDSSLVKKFRVTVDSYQDLEEAIETRNITVTGRTDMQTGPVRRTWRFHLLVWETDLTDASKADGDTEGYGTVAHLETFFRYRDPSASPSNQVTFTDHEGGTHTIYMRGAMLKRPLGSSTTGTNAIFRIAVILEEYD